MATEYDRDNCTLFHLPEHDFTIIGSIIAPLLAASGLLILAGCCVGISGCFKKTYKTTLLISAGVVVKLAKIPGVTITIEQDEDRSGGEGESIGEEEGRSEVEGSGNEAVSSVANTPPPENNDETQDVNGMGKLRKRMQIITEDFKARREKKREYFRKQQEKTVFFEMNFGDEKQKFWVMPVAAPLLLATGGVLILSYMSIFLTDQWQTSQECKETNAFGLAHNCYRGFDPCPPLNCTAWNQVGLKENLFCVTETFDLFSPLIKIVSLLSVQVFLLGFFSCVFNEGCCRGSGLRYPPCRYTCLCSLHLAFICAVILVLVALLASGTQDEVTTFVTVIVPFLHILFVSLAEWVILFVFTALLWLMGPYQSRVSLHGFPRCCCLKEHQETASVTTTATGTSKTRSAGAQRGIQTLRN